MNRNFFFLPLIPLLLIGCKNDDKPIFTETDSNVIVPEITHPPVSYNTALLSSGLIITGDIICNEQQLINGFFSVMENSRFHCQFGSVDLGTYQAPSPNSQQRLVNNPIEQTSFDLSDQFGANATRVLQSINQCPNEANKLCLREFESFDIQDIWKNLNNEQAVTDFLTPKKDQSIDEVGKAPSSHDSATVPAVTAGASNDLNHVFVSPNAEETYAYKPSSDNKILTTSRLLDSNGKPIKGVNFYSKNSTGITNSRGEFEYLWGDTLTFGIDTFEFGQLKGNQIDYKLTEVSENPITKANIQSLLERYSQNTDEHIEITDEVRKVFAKYPNVINELININLPNGSVIEGTGFTIPNDFEAQFQRGLAAEIDQTLNPVAFYSNSYHSPAPITFKMSGYVTDTLSKLFNGVDNFHVFHDNNSFYGASGYARGMRALNINNRAFPIMSSRADINREIPLGEPQAWTREGRPHITTDQNVTLPPPPLVNKENVTFTMPFVTAGEIGKGKVVFMGNSLYPSIISCPNAYWAGDKLLIDSASKTCTAIDSPYNNAHTDHGSMNTFLINLFTWFNHDRSIKGIDVGTNITTAYAARANHSMGRPYEFFVNPSFGFGAVEHISSGGFGGLSPTNIPMLLLQAYSPVNKHDGITGKFLADTNAPTLNQDDITALIKYVNNGGNILFMDALETQNPEPIARLADAAGVVLGGSNVTPTDQGFCGSSYYCQTPYPNLRVKTQYDMVVIEQTEDVEGQPPYSVKPDGTVVWIPDASKIKLTIPTYQTRELNAQGEPISVTKYAQIFVKNNDERDKAIAQLQSAFPNTPICTETYQYEINCIEVRQGDGMVDRGAYQRSDFDRYQVTPDVIDALIKSSNLGDLFTSLYDHELYYRTKGQQGHRLSNTELNQTYDNLGIWMWNDNPYEYDGTHHHDELGFQTMVQFLNCYTNNQHQTNGQDVLCPDDLKQSLIEHKMLETNGEMNPSYPLNYTEKPLTRIMLGRSFWDHQIVVDTTKYPGRSTGSPTTATAIIELGGEAVNYSAGNRQSTGLWAPQLSTVTVSGGVPATITIMLADNLTGKTQHEKNLNRPPRMEQTFSYDGSSLSFQVPYGGLIYIKPLGSTKGSTSFNLSGVELAPWWKEGDWVHPASTATAPIGEVDTGTMIYTAPKQALEGTDLAEFSRKMNLFTEAANDFYGRDEVTEQGNHRRFTYPDLKGFRHQFVEDVQISIGAAHSGYPVMASGFNANDKQIDMDPLNSWLLWHEIGHNLAAPPFAVAGGTEVTNNLLALYMQEHEVQGSKAQMTRIKNDIQKAPLWIEKHQGHAWSEANAAMRLVMYGQLKTWAASNFSIGRWYPDADNKPSIYGDDEGWNMFKLMHRKTRGDTQGDQLDGRKGKNYCSAKETGLSGADLMMSCSSYVSGYDLSDFFGTWNPGEVSMTHPDGTKSYEGGITAAGLGIISELNLAKPNRSPLQINKLDQ